MSSIDFRFPSSVVVFAAGFVLVCSFFVGLFVGLVF